jgi:hypothetical protein
MKKILTILLAAALLPVPALAKGTGTTASTARPNWSLSERVARLVSIKGTPLNASACSGWKYGRIGELQKWKFVQVIAQKVDMDPEYAAMRFNSNYESLFVPYGAWGDGEQITTLVPLGDDEGIWSAALSGSFAPKQVYFVGFEAPKNNPEQTIACSALFTR